VNERSVVLRESVGNRHATTFREANRVNPGGFVYGEGVAVVVEEGEVIHGREDTRLREKR
jgi:hypothetical protein